MTDNEHYTDGTNRFDTPENCKEIICEDCGSPPRLLSLDKNPGTTLCCDCDDVKHHQDAVPYEYATHHMPESWSVQPDTDRNGDDTDE